MFFNIEYVGDSLVVSYKLSNNFNVYWDSFKLLIKVQAKGWLQRKLCNTFFFMEIRCNNQSPLSNVNFFNVM